MPRGSYLGRWDSGTARPRGYRCNRGRGVQYSPSFTPPVSIARPGTKRPTDSQALRSVIYEAQVDTHRPRSEEGGTGFNGNDLAVQSLRESFKHLETKLELLRVRVEVLEQKNTVSTMTSPNIVSSRPVYNDWTRTEFQAEAVREERPSTSTHSFTDVELNRLEELAKRLTAGGLPVAVKKELMK